MPLDVHPTEQLLKRMAGYSGSMLSSARKVPRLLKYGYLVLTRTALFALAVVLIVATGKAVFGRHIVIEPISVPKKLEDDGYSGAVISRRLLEEVRSISQSGNVLHVQTVSRQPSERVSFRSEDDFASLDTIQVPSSGVTLRSMALMVRDFLGIPEQRITGEIIVRHLAKADGGKTAGSADAKTPAQTDSYAIFVRFGSATDPLTKSSNADDIDDAIRQSAPSIAERFDPVGLAAYYFSRREWAKMEKVASGLIARSEPSLRKEGLYLRGLHALNFEQYDMAIPYFAQAVLADEGFADAYNSWGTALAGKKQYAKALAQYNKANELTPLNPNILYNRALAYHNRRDFDHAIEDYSLVVKLDPKNAAAYTNRGMAWEAKRDIDRALQDYDRAIAIDPGFYYAYSNRTPLLCDKGEFDKAMGSANRAIELEPKYSNAYNQRGYCYSDMGKRELAIKDYDKALEIDPLNSSALNNRCYERALRGQPELAFEDCDEALRLEPATAGYYDSRGYAWLKLGRFDKAIADFDAGLKLDPGMAETLFERGVARRRQGDTAGGDADIAAATKIKPSIAGDMAKIGVQP